MKQKELNIKRWTIRKRNEDKIESKQNERIQNRERKKEDDVEMGWFLKKATSDYKVFVNSWNLRETGNQILVAYPGDFDMIGDNVFGEHKKTIAMRFENIEHYEACNNSIDMDYDADDTSFTVYIYKLITTEFNKIERSEYRKRNNFRLDVVEVIDYIGYTPTSGYCFTKCIKILKHR